MPFISGADSSFISVSVVLCPWAFRGHTLTAGSWQSPSGRVPDCRHGFGLALDQEFLSICPVWPPLWKRSCPKGFVALEMGGMCFALAWLPSVLVRAAWGCLWVVLPGFLDNLIALAPVEIGASQNGGV